MVLLVTKSAQRALYDIVMTTFMSRQVLLLGGSVFVVSTAVAMSLLSNTITSDMEQLAATEGQGFGAFTSALLTMFNFVFIGENFGAGTGLTGYLRRCR